MASLGSQGHPPRVAIAPRLRVDLGALTKMFQQDPPTELNVQSHKAFQVICGFGDASGKGFDDSFKQAKGLSVHTGVWASWMKLKSSNHHKLVNHWNALRKEGEQGVLKDTFVIFCTDNFTVEGAVFKGTSLSPETLDLVIELHALCTQCGFELIAS